MKNKILIYSGILLILISLLIGCKAKTYIVEFDSNGGTTISSQEIREDERVVKPTDPIKEGYVFNGWYLENKKFDFNQKITKDIKLVAKWDVQQYTVTFKYNNDQSDEVLTVNANSKVSVPTTPEKTGYIFNGWYNGNELYDFNNLITSNLILEAKWESNVNVYDSVGKWIGIENVDNEEYIYKLTINSNLSGSIICVNKNNKVDTTINSISVEQGYIVIKFNDFNFNQKILKLNLNNNNMIGSGLYSETITFKPLVQHTVTYHYYNGKSETLLVDEYDKFSVKKIITAPSDDLSFVGWYTDEGVLCTNNTYVISDLEVTSVVYTNGLVFNENEVNYYYGEQTKVIIPSYYDGFKITKIAKETFIKSKVTDVVIPDTVVLIDESAFAESYYLETVEIKGKVETIGKNAFKECYSLKNINLNEGLKLIDEYAFYACINLTNVNLPTSLEQIEMFAFSMTNINKITFPSAIQKIGGYAFHGCNNLEEVIFINDLPCEIGSTIFTYIGEDENIYYSDFPIWVPNNNENEKPYLHYRNHVYLRDYASSIYPIKYVGQKGYIVDENLLLGYIRDENEEALLVVEVPNGVEKIEDYSFYGNVKIEEVVMPEGFKKIGKYAFYNCTSVQNLYIPSTMEEIDDYAFTGFFVGNKLSRLYLPEGFKRIGEGTFMSSFNLKIVELPSTIEYIGYLAFGMMTSLERMYFKGEVPPQVGSYANNVEEVSTEIFEIMNSSNAIIYVPYGYNSNNEKILDIYHNAPGFENFKKYIKAKPEGPEVGHYGDGTIFIDLDGCDTATIYTIVESEEDTSDFGGSKYEYKKENGTYKLNGFRLDMSFPTYGDIVAVYANRTLAFTYEGINYKLIEPKKYYDTYNWTNFMLYETSTNSGKGTFDMYGSFLTPFEWTIDNDVFKIKIDGNNKDENHQEYIGTVEYTGTYNKTTDTFSVSFMMNDYEPLMEYNATYVPIVYASGEVTSLYGKYVAYHETNKDFAMYTLVSYGNGIVDVYIGEVLYSNCTYTLKDGKITIDLQSLTLELFIDKDGNLSGNIFGQNAFFKYVDELLDSSKLPTD